MRILPLFCVAILLVTAGCVASPLGGASDHAQPVKISTSNTGNTTYTFEVRVVEYPTKYTAKHNDGKVGTSKMREGLVNHDPGPRTMTNLTFTESSRVHSRHTLAPGENRTSSIEEYPNEFAVVVIIYNENGNGISWVSAYCADSTLAGLSVSADASGASPSYGC